MNYYFLIAFSLWCSSLTMVSARLNKKTTVSTPNNKRYTGGPNGTGRIPEVESKEIKRDQVTVTSGDVFETAEGFFTQDGQTRATVHTGYWDNDIMLKFQYQGESLNDKPLASGVIRRQIGMKLANANPCNLLYIMWEMEPVKRISVFLKSNPGQDTSSECGVNGYTRLDSDEQYDTSNLEYAEDHETHRLMAHLTPLRNSYDKTVNDYLHFQLNVFADFEQVFSKTIYNLPLEVRGPAGLRTDNGSFLFHFYSE